ncbi:hypothetical protein BH23CHL5_BH23CHL5_06240 [soil metagenome]
MKHRVINRRYRLEKKLRTSGDSVFYHGYDALLQRPVGVGLLDPTLADNLLLRDSFLYRNQQASTLHHRNLMAIFDIGEEDDAPYVVTEHIAGETLETIIAHEAPFDVDDVAILIEQLAQGLNYAMQRGLIHGKLRPADIVVDAAGLARISGIGRIEGQLWSEQASRAEVPQDPYLPSGIRGTTPISHQLDVHALAAIAWVMFVGEPPESPRSQLNVQNGLGDAFPYQNPADINPAVPARAGEIVVRGLTGYLGSTGLTAEQFSHALTNWRSWTEHNSQNQQRYAIGMSASEQPRPRTSQTQQMNNPFWTQGWDQVQSTASPKRSRIPSMLVTLVLLLSIAFAIALMQTSEAGPAAILDGIPQELQRIIPTG